MALPFAPPCPPAPWQDSQRVLYATSPCETLPADFGVYEGGLAPLSAPGRLQRARICVVITSICLSVSNPPALTTNAGIAVPGTPLPITLRIEPSSAIARYTAS